MQSLVFVIGVVATGKTHFINQNYRDKDADILDIYDYQQRVYDEEWADALILSDPRFRCLMQANNLLLEDIIEKLSQGRDLVVEQTFYKAKRRIVYIDEIRKRADVTIEMYVMSPSDSLWESNIRKRDLEGDLQKLKEDAKIMEFPNPAEGIDAIYEVTDGEVILRMDPPRPEILVKAREELEQEAERIHREDEAIRKYKKRKELIESMKVRPFWHYCEVCGKKAFITAQDAFDSGWNYPPNMGNFGILGPRTCGNCQLKDTLFWEKDNKNRMFTPKELATWERIIREPESLLVDED